MVGLAYQLQGFGPGFFVDNHRQYLRREEGTIVNRHDVDLVRQILPGQGQAGAMGTGLFGIFRIEVLTWIFGKCLLVAHEGSCAMGYAG